MPQHNRGEAVVFWAPPEFKADLQKIAARDGAKNFSATVRRLLRSAMAFEMAFHDVDRPY
jgi:hypothetical protein